MKLRLSLAKLKTNFKEGVEEFSEGSTCNEKIVIFWGKCKFKEGFGRSFLLDKKKLATGN